MKIAPCTFQLVFVHLNISCMLWELKSSPHFGLSSCTVFHTNSTVLLFLRQKKHHMVSLLLVTTFVVNSGAVAPELGGTTAWHSHDPEPDETKVHLDLDLCSNKGTFTSNRCPSRTAIACWSQDATSNWWCLGEAMIGTRAASGLPWDVACVAESYSGACTYGHGARERQAHLLPKLMSWDDATAKAKETLKSMTMDQKTSLLQGSGWVPTKWWFDLPRFYYVGNTPAIPELGIPSLNMQDATDGFRTYWTDLKGTVTVWPSVLSMAATWDPIAVQDWAVVLGKSFIGKGANVILGPGVQVQRVARCGRSFEYLAGREETELLGVKGSCRVLC